VAEALAPERWRQLRPLLDQALDLDVEARAAFLAAVERETPEIAADLRRLLARNDAAGVLEAPAAELLGERLLATPAAGGAGARFVGRRIGAFELRRLVGSGGMGMVYEAERVSGGFRQRVAIKLISGVHPGLHERFERERQILAELRHPNIPQLFDGGETDDGMPYFVLEFVEGVPLPEHADQVAAGLDERLTLLVKVAAALAYAHECKVMHRDIKPGNILVTADGQVKLLDFGISKLLDDTGQPTLTRQLLGPMTPEYAAPEQFRGEALGVATDIYQFGVLMFQVLAGRSPYRATTADSLAFMRAVCDEPPLSLQSMPTSEPSGEPDTGRRRSLRQRRIDLDRIVQRCLAKAPGRRYPDMASLIADLEAVRGDDVPQARRQGDRRRRRGLALVVLLLVALVATAWLIVPTLLREQDPWRRSPALHAMGLDRQHLHLTLAESEEMLRRAMMAEARGDVGSALALLESVHEADAQSPVPAMLLGLWSHSYAGAAVSQEWMVRAEQRLQRIDDPLLHLLLRYFRAELEGDHEAAFGMAGAVLEIRPDAWFMHYARSHLLSLRGLTAASLRELQKIDVDRLDHRKLIDAIADRASWGDRMGADRIAERLVADAEGAEGALLDGRLRFTAGDLEGARDGFAQSVARARAVAHTALESRGLLYLGFVEGSLGNHEAATVALRAAQARFEASNQYGFAIDATLLLAQLAEFAGNRPAVEREIARARSLRAQFGGDAIDPLVELFAARLLGVVPAEPVAGPPALRAFIAARAALLRGEADTALRLAREAADLGVGETRWRDEYALLCRDLGLPLPALPPLDPPLQPTSRFASRWALGVPVAPSPR
jgi:serine/threonine protein kinase